MQGVNLGDVIKCVVTRNSNGKVEMSIVKEEEEDDGKGSLVIVTATKTSLEGTSTGMYRIERMSQVFDMD